MPETAKRTARVPILGEDGRISDDYVPAAIGEGVEAAEAAAKRAETAATDAEGSATAASQSATDAQSSASAASTSATKAQESATAASGAVTQAQSAQKAAEAAKTGAESARDSAQTAASQAQQSATAAAESAGQVADKFIASAQATTLEPGSEATASVADQVLTLGIPRGDKGDKGDTGEKGDPGDVSAVKTAEGSDLSVSTDGGTVTIDDSALRARIAELENQAANVVTGTATGKVAHAEDAYATKPRKLTVQGKTRQNLWMNPSGTGNGVTVTANDNGSVTVSGTSTGIFNPFTQIYTVRPESTYTLSVDKVVQSSTNASAGCFFIEIHDGDSTLMTKYAGFGTTVSVTFTAPADTTFTRVGFYCSTGTTVSGTYRVMLNEGSEPEPWCPPGLNSVDELSIVTAGKNLAIVENIGTGSEAYNKLVSTSLPEGSYTISGVLRSDIAFNIKDGEMFGELIKGNVTSLPVTISVKSGQSIFINAYSTGDADYSKNIISDLQVELGSTPTDYEPPSVTTTPLPEVELRSLPNGTCDELVIKADGTCEVERCIGESVIDAEHPVTVSRVVPGSGTDLPYASVSELFVRFDHGANPAMVMLSTSWPYTNSLKTRGVYRTWNSVLFVDERFTDKETAQSIINEIGGTFVAQVPSTTEPQSPVTLPALPAPTFNQYHDADVPSDTTVTYERDINIAFDNLAKQVAGTASAVAVREASTIEEE